MTALSILILCCLYCFLPILRSDSLEVGQVRIYDRNEVLIAHLPKEDGLQMPIKPDEVVPDQLTKALIQVEDKRFDRHFGVDLLAKLRALRSNLAAGRVVSGGSTLTEQWIKNRYFRGKRRTLVQKLRESTLALYFSARYSKNEILNHYLNDAYFGHQLYGVKAASYVYFQKFDLNALTDQEIAILITLLRAPSTLTSDEVFFAREREKVMKKMNLEEAPTKKQFSKFESKNKFPHVTSKVISELEGSSDKDLTIKTTIDFDLQEKAIHHLQNSLDRLSGHQVSNAAIYAFNPQNGDVLVWQGSKDFHDTDIDGQVNVIEKKRQMGSALKPFIYLFAFLNGAHPDHLIVDLEKDFYEDQEEGMFRPLNYTLQEGGVITLKEALASSFNISAVRLLEHLGLHRSYDFLRSIGLKLDFEATHYGLSLALGSPDLTMKNVAEVYGTLANGGRKVEASLIHSINGKKLQKPGQSLLPETPVAQEALYHLDSTLSSQVHRRRSFGLSSILNTSLPFAVKTGTTANFKDNWTFGYRPDLVVAVWVGNNDGSSMIDVTGITGSAPIWHRVVEDAIKEGFVREDQKQAPASLQVSDKCLDAECFRKELIYQNDEKKWLSDFDQGNFCLEDFFIQDIDIKEVQKIAKLFNFKDFSIHWCEKEVEEEIMLEPAPSIIKPADGEIFYIKKNLPLELQKIIIKATEPVDWLINEAEYTNTDLIFLQPSQESYNISIKNQTEERKIFINYVE